MEGYDFKNLPVGTRFRCGKVLLEMTQIGKECHSHCQIYQRMGECIMPHEGVFAAGDVVQGANTVVHAVEEAKRAAEGMIRYMEREENE